MAAMAASWLQQLGALHKRQDCDDLYEDCYVPFWDTNTGLIVRYAVVAGVFILVVVFLLAAYFHAQRRIKRGQPLLAYHRWLIRPRYYNQSQVYYNNAPVGRGYGAPQEYAMQPQQYAPPAYTNWDAPPRYQPPAGGTKVLANQHVGNTPMHTGAGEPSQVQQPEAARWNRDSRGDMA